MVRRSFWSSTARMRAYSSCTSGGCGTHGHSPAHSQRVATVLGTSSASKLTRPTWSGSSTKVMVAGNFDGRGRGSHFHLFCSEKGNHAGYPARDSDKMKFYFDQLPRRCGRRWSSPTAAPRGPMFATTDTTAV